MGSFDKIDGDNFEEHADELPFVFQHPELAAIFPSKVMGGIAPATAQGLASMYGTYWTQFAKTQDPNGPDFPAWTRYSGAAPHVLIINATTPTLAVPSYQGKCAFWQTLLGGSSAPSTPEMH